VPQVNQESVTIDTLNLLQKTLDYLNRLPVVPMTRTLCREIEAHLADPSVAAAKREAADAERRATTRVGQSFSPAWQVTMEVTVTADTVTCRLPKVWRPPGTEDALLKALRSDKGVTLDLHVSSRALTSSRDGLMNDKGLPLDLEAIKS